MSPKGWTDQELGSLWLEKDFEPKTAARNISGKHRLLILDGHNSHCTHKFLHFAHKHDILVLCLPSHTTHALQPCDVGVFGPLATAWKAEVAKASRQHTPITKQNFLVHYHNARLKAMKPSTIIAAFRKTGIWPINADAIDPILFKPSENTTTESAQPIPAQLPSILVPIDEGHDISALSPHTPSRSLPVSIHGTETPSRIPILSTRQILDSTSHHISTPSSALISQTPSRIPVLSVQRTSFASSESFQTSRPHFSAASETSTRLSSTAPSFSTPKSATCFEWAITASCMAGTISFVFFLLYSLSNTGPFYYT